MQLNENQSINNKQIRKNLFSKIDINMDNNNKIIKQVII